MKRVLFIDDDQAVLDGLRRTLRSRRSEWDMTFVPVPADALQILSRESVDVVISDMRMPGMDGARFLAQVQKLSPRTVRLFLSGNVSQEASLRSACVSHQFLSKPCDPDTLQHVIERACALEELLSDRALQDVLGEVTDLPALPRTFHALVLALADPEVDLRVVSSIVEQDLAITARVLQVVNSSFFSFGKEVTSVHQATTYMGTAMIRDLVLTAEIARQFEGADDLAGFSMERQQQHSMLASRIARRLLADRRLADQAFLAAMLHDIGKLVMSRYFPKQMQSLLAAGAGTTVSFHALETRLGQVGHGIIGAYLLGLWGMPYPIVDSVAHHHDRDQVAAQRQFGVLAAVHVADMLANEAMGTPDAPIDEPLLSGLGVLGRLPEWRAIAAEEQRRGRNAA
jgi:HD-like signal output (HDOD) protein/CheY-like chemotaxis protein